MTQNMKKRKPRNAKLGGRPRKFNEPSRPITLTLPERTLTLLESVDSDRAVAIARAADLVTSRNELQAAPVEIVEVEKGRAVIIVGPSRSLRQIPWLRLVEIAPLRFLLVLPTGTPIETLEVAIMDLIDSLPRQEEYERKLLTELRRCLTHQRRTHRVCKAELLLIDLSK